MNSARMLLIVGAFTLPVCGAAAQAPTMPSSAEAAPVCDGPAPLPPELAGWEGARASVKAAASPAAPDAPLLPVGQAVEATLLPTPAVAYAIRPEKPGGSVSKGGLFLFEAATAGRYRVALGSGAWIDVIEAGKPAVSVAHGRGPACSSVRKMVDYDLAAGRHLIQISANGTETLLLMVTKLP